ncbi:MAG: 30S ribosomal protein S12 methylthiotransferase RimO [Elusimicrobia bacterium]|nr:30S ribosomal protein S12 methylthiotransferase RimO [Elusimicrobiota bacterium]
MKKVYAVSLGCPKNLTDSEEALAGFRAQGYALVSGSEEKADAAFLNTCGFLKSSVAEAKSHIRRLAALKRAGKIRKIVVAGCLVQRLGVEKLSAEFPEVDVFAGVSATAVSADLLKAGESAAPEAAGALCAPAGRLRLTLPHTAYLKIAEGCANNCSYCAIPSIRGPLRSKPPAHVLAEARALAASGAKELVLIAQESTAYGRDLPGKPSLPRLLERLARVRGVEWIRVLYARPERLDENLLRVMAREPKICKYLDIPLQHCRDGVLKAMNRPYGQESISRKLAMARRLVPGIALRTTFISGFPGETAADSRALERFIKKERFASLGVFAYSREPGTAAYSLPQTVPPAEARRRRAALLRAQDAVAAKLGAGMVGRVFTVLMDTPVMGRTYMDAPDIDGFVEVSSGRPLQPGTFVRVKITSARGYARKGVAV